MPGSEQVLGADMVEVRPRLRTAQSSWRGARLRLAPCLGGVAFPSTPAVGDASSPGAGHPQASQPQRGARAAASPHPGTALERPLGRAQRRGLAVRGPDPGGARAVPVRRDRDGAVGVVQRLERAGQPVLRVGRLRWAGQLRAAAHRGRRADPPGLLDVPAEQLLLRTRGSAGADGPGAVPRRRAQPAATQGPRLLPHGLLLAVRDELGRDQHRLPVPVHRQRRRQPAAGAGRREPRRASCGGADAYGPPQKPL